jgi:hypothetical protein
MMEAVEPITVWAVRLGEYTDEVRGKLVLDEEESRVSFLHDKQAKTAHISLGSIRRVRRIFGSPVLVIDFATSEGMGRMAFFFAQPPPMQEPTLVGRGRRRKRENIQFLMGENAARSADVKRWRNAVRRAVREART